MIRIGITGGIGSGKSLVCKILSSMGYPVFYSDQQAKEIIQHDLQVRAKIIAHFGEKAFLENELNRAYLAEKIFKNPADREKINQIVHPKVREAFDQFAKKSESTLVFNEAAILFETGTYKNFDTTILICSPEEKRIERIIKRDNCSREQALARMETQWTDEQKRGLANFIIENSDETLVIPQIVAVLLELKELEKLRELTSKI